MKKVIIYGAETQAHIALIRALKQGYLKTLVLAKSTESVGRFSIFAHEMLVMPSDPPPEEYLENLVKHRKITHIVTADIQDSIFLAKLKAQGLLGDIQIMDHDLTILENLQDKAYVKQIFEDINQPFIKEKIITPDDDLDEIMLHTTYPAYFFNNHKKIEQREILSARNFIDFKRKVKSILDNGHAIAQIDTKFYRSPLYQDHYLLSDGKIENFWRSCAYLSPYERFFNKNTVTIMPQNQLVDSEVSMVILQIAKKLSITKDLISVHYYKDYKSDTLTFVNIVASTTCQSMPLFQNASVKMIQARLKLYGFKHVKKTHKEQKKSYLYISGAEKYKIFMSVSERFTHRTLKLLQAKFVFPLLDSDDLNPLICILWRFCKSAPFKYIGFLVRKIKKYYADYRIAQNMKKFDKV